MTVAALIAFLQTQPKDRIVVTSYMDGNYWDEELKYAPASPELVAVLPESCAKATHYTPSTFDHPKALTVIAL